MTADAERSHSVSATSRRFQRNQLTNQLFAVFTSGHDGLNFNVDQRGAVVALTEVVKGKRVSISGGGGDVPRWQRAREWRAGEEHNRRFTPEVMRQHVRGAYSVAPGADRWWLEWAAVDIDAHPATDAPELVARRLAKERADRVLAGVWRALRCSAERQPVIERTPGHGYRLWLPLTRGKTSPYEHSWPASKAHGWLERCLRDAGLALKPGVLEIYPSGRYLRAPCGPGCVLLQATRPDDADALGLVPWPGTSQARIDWSGKQPELVSTQRNIDTYLEAFLGEWEAQRRTPADWFSNPAASWDPTWGPLGRRRGEQEEIPPANIAEKKTAEATEGVVSRSQESVDDPRRPQAGGQPVAFSADAGLAGDAQVSPRKRSASGSAQRKKTLSTPVDDPDCPPAPVSKQWVCGPAFRKKVYKLLADGVTEPSTRHDATLTLSFYWHVTCGLAVEPVLARLEGWCVAHPHRGSQLADEPAKLLKECVREARSYLEGRERRGQRRRFVAGGQGGAGTLTATDRVVLDAVDARVREEVATVLCWLAGRADAHGRVVEAVQIASGLLRRLCGDRRIIEDGKRRRATTLAILELERLGILTLAQQYAVGQRGREFACWYRFGSGRLPDVLELPAVVWDKLAPAAAQKTPQSASSPTIVVTRVVGEQIVPEGVVRLLSAGTRERPRALAELPPDAGQAVAPPGTNDSWVARAYQTHGFVAPAELAAANLAAVIPFPDRARRRARPTGPVAQTLGKVIPLRAEGPGPSPSPAAESSAESCKPPAASAPSADPSVVDPRAEHAANVGDGLALDNSSAALRAELAAEVGDDAAAVLPPDVADVIAQAWRGFRRDRGRDP